MSKYLACITPNEVIQLPSYILHPIIREILGFGFWERAVHVRSRKPGKPQNADETEFKKAPLSTLTARGMDFTVLVYQFKA